MLYEYEVEFLWKENIYIYSIYPQPAYNVILYFPANEVHLPLPPYIERIFNIGENNKLLWNINGF